MKTIYVWEHDRNMYVQNMYVLKQVCISTQFYLIILLLLISVFFFCIKYNYKNVHGYKFAYMFNFWKMLTATRAPMSICVEYY